MSFTPGQKVIELVLTPAEFTALRRALIIAGSQADVPRDDRKELAKLVAQLDRA